MEVQWDNKVSVANALIALYRKQTPDEQEYRATAYNNQVGFNATDAGFCSSVAEWVLAGKPFTDKQFNAMQRILPKYKHQLEILSSPEISLVDRSNDHKKIEQKSSGTVEIVADLLVFWPNVYPTTVLKQLGWRGGKENGKFYWSKRLSPEALNDLINRWGDLVGLPEVETALEAQKQKQNLPQIDEHEILFDFQKQAVKFLVSNKRAMLALAPGLGKTACAVLAADTIDAHKILVVAPLTLLRNWANEIQKWLDKEQIIEIRHGNEQRWERNSARWVVTNYDTLRRNIKTFLADHWDLVIFDETILVKNHKAQRTKAAARIAKLAECVWELSGAPISRFLDDMYAQMQILDPKRFSSYWRWAGRYCLLERNQWGTAIVGNKREAHDLVKYDCGDIYFARTQQEVLPNLPDWIFDTIEVELKDDQWEQYRSMEDKFFAALPESDETILAPNVLAQLTRLIQLASDPMLPSGKSSGVGTKFSAVAELLDIEQLPAIVWTNYIATAEKLVDILKEAKLRVACLTGATKEQDRQQIVDKFQNGELDTIVAHPAVGKFGLTLTAARTAIYMERSYNGDDYYQSLHRVRRIGTTHSPHVILLLSVGPKGQHTIDHVIHRVLRYRAEQAVKLTTGLLRETLEK